MNEYDSKAILSDIDEVRFRVRTAKVMDLMPNELDNVLNFCRLEDVKFLIARCRTTNLDLTHKMEESGFHLMDTLIYYSCDLRKSPPPDYISEIMVRPFKAGEEGSIGFIATEAFKGYLGHYHADQNLDKTKCDEVYIDWAYRSCSSKAVADEVFVAEFMGEIIGFGTVKVNSSGEGQYILAGVLRERQGLGVYRLILINCMKWCIENGINRMITATQITNLGVQKVWVRLGFEPSNTFYTFHKWFKGPDENIG